MTEIRVKKDPYYATDGHLLDSPSTTGLRQIQNGLENTLPATPTQPPKENIMALYLVELTLANPSMEEATAPHRDRQLLL